MAKIYVELSENEGPVDYNYEMIIILAHLAHDGQIKVLNSRFHEDTDLCDGSHGFLALEFTSSGVKENAMWILKKRGYLIFES